MVTVRIAHAKPRPGRLGGSGVFYIDRVLVVLADDAGGRALPVWLPSMDGYSIQVLLDRPPGETALASRRQGLAVPAGPDRATRAGRLRLRER